ncbi:MAG: tetratricopeptide repeat protein [bacterium]|nr:tetratricopeptide repeat protein [bacterium]
MNKKLLLISVSLGVLVLVAGGVVAYRLLSEPPREWTTRSPRALKELEEGLADLKKMYRPDALRHFEKALELDPDFAMAKLELSYLEPSGSERKKLAKELDEVDLGTLTARERFLLTYHMARRAHRPGDSEAILRTFLGQHPGDPYGLRIECGLAWQAQEWDQAESCYVHLLELHPNWLEAYNNLGYLALARGRFGEAEERFRTYRYLAPEQAGPHHSLAVLFTLRGRYEEAEKELDELLGLKSDFCAAYVQRADLAFMSGRPDLARQALRQVTKIDDCGYLEERGAICALGAWVLYLDGDAEGAWRRLDGACLERLEGFDLLAHRIAVMTDRNERGTEMEATLRRYRDKVSEAGKPVHARFMTALLQHMEGIRSLTEGDLPRAIELLSEADRSLGYWGGERANIKLFNRLNLLRALELAGRTPEALALRQEIDKVNNRLVEDLRLPDVDALRRVGGEGLPPSFPLREDQHQ